MVEVENRTGPEKNNVFYYQQPIAPGQITVLGGDHSGRDGLRDDLTHYLFRKGSLRLKEQFDVRGVVLEVAGKFKFTFVGYK